MPHTPPPFWKVLSFILPLTLLGVIPVLLFMRHPNYMTVCVSVIRFFIIFLLLNFIVPEHRAGTRPDSTKITRVFLWVLFTEFFIFLLSHNFSIFAFNLSEQAQTRAITFPHWPVWLGLWAYFSTIISLQHYVHYQLHQASFASGLFFFFKNTYIDIAIRRALGLFNLGLNLTGIYLLIISIIFIIIEYFQPGMLQYFHITSILFWGLFLYFNLCIQEKKIKTILNRTTLPNIFYLFIVSLCCAAAVWISSILSRYFSLTNISSNIHFVSEKPASSQLIDPSSFLFIAMFILVTPLFASLIVKHAGNISRKKLLLLSFFLPNIFYLILHDKHTGIFFDISSNKIVFVSISLIFLVIFFRGRTTEDFMTGALSLPKQRAIIPTLSYLLFPANCLVLFNFYLLAIIIGPVSLYAITTTASLLSAILGTIGICSYFGKTYRTSLLTKHSK